MTDLAWLFFSNATDRLILSFLGITISLYSLYIEVKKAKQPDFKALCDFSETMSCSRVLTSRYAKGFGLVGYLVGENSVMNPPNCALGVIFYLLQTLTVLCEPTGWLTTVTYFSTILANFGSVYLAYILFVVLKDVCVLCMATYATNACMLFLVHSAYVHL